MLSDAFLSRLDALMLRVRHPASGGSGGLRRSKALGSSVEFSDFREYAMGDDIRRIDWNAYARFDRLFLKLFMEEQEQRINLIVDASASMAFGEPSKWQAAKLLAETLCYLALCGGDSVTLYALADGGEQHTRPLSGRHSYPQASAFLEGVTPSAQALTDFSTLPLPSGRGLSVLLSDLLWEDGFERPLQMLRYRRQETAAVQIWSQEEWEPTQEDYTELQDSESGQRFLINASYDMLARYQKTATAYVDEVRDFCRANEMTHLFLIPRADIEQQLLTQLSQAGLIG